MSDRPFSSRVRIDLNHIMELVWIASEEITEARPNRQHIWSTDVNFPARVKNSIRLPGEQVGILDVFNALDTNQSIEFAIVIRGASD